MHRILASTIGALLALTSCMRQQPEERVHKLLTDRIQTLATAESCTGGTIAARFTAMPGASAYFKCGVVTYSLDAKQNFVNICCDTIARYGAVSEQVVRQMAEGVRHLANAHYAIATTGIAGPTGGTKAKPVGTVWFAWCVGGETHSEMQHFAGDRAAVRVATVRYALKRLLSLLPA